LGQQAHTAAAQKTFRLFKERKLHFTHLLREFKGLREGCEIYCGQISTAWNLETVAKLLCFGGQRPSNGSKTDGGITNCI
jgi:hypothetical protein